MERSRLRSTILMSFAISSASCGGEDIPRSEESTIGHREDLSPSFVLCQPAQIG